MKKLFKVFGVVLALVVCLGIFNLIVPPCKEPDDSITATAYIRCTMGVTDKDMSNIRDIICKKLDRGVNCELTGEDLSVAEEVIQDYMSSCAKRLLKADGYCIDNLKKIEELQ